MRPLRVKLVKNDLFKQLTGRAQSSFKEYENCFLESHTLEAFKSLKSLAKFEANIDLQIVSSFRSFNDQKIIWNKKARGEKKVYDDFDIEVEMDLLSPRDFMLKIMRFSAIPGASRHHWGTDIDIYDANQISKQNLKLLHSECVGDGPNAKLHQWLDEKILQDESLSFFRPYEKDLGGVSVEKWHISYADVSAANLENYTLDLFIQNLEQSDFQFKDLLMDQSELYFNTYIKNISSPPLY